MNTSSQADAPRLRARVAVIGDARVEVHRDERGSRELVGGRGLDAAIGLSLLGDEPTLVAELGDDTHGDRLRTVLRDYGVRLVDGASARRAVAEADLVVVSGFPFEDGARIDALTAALERPELRFVVDGERPAGMPHAREVHSTDLARPSEQAGDATAPLPGSTVAAVAHLLVHGVAPAPRAAWDGALEAALARLAAAALPGRSDPRARPAPDDRGS